MKNVMKIFGRLVSFLLMVVGTTWFLQGIDVLPGSFMTGQTIWAVYGGLCWAAGWALWYLCRRAGGSQRHP